MINFYKQKNNALPEETKCFYIEVFKKSDHEFVYIIDKKEKITIWNIFVWKIKMINFYKEEKTGTLTLTKCSSIEVYKKK